MERTDLKSIEDALWEVYDKAFVVHNLDHALSALHGLLEIQDRKEGTKGVGFGYQD